MSRWEFGGLGYGFATWRAFECGRYAGEILEWGWVWDREFSLVIMGHGRFVVFGNGLLCEVVWCGFIVGWRSWYYGTMDDWNGMVMHIL